jgi:hypothetical protein
MRQISERIAKAGTYRRAPGGLKGLSGIVAWTARIRLDLATEYRFYRDPNGEFLLYCSFYAYRALGAFMPNYAGVFAALKSRTGFPAIPPRSLHPFQSVNRF